MAANLGRRTPPRLALSQMTLVASADIDAVCTLISRCPMTTSAVPTLPVQLAGTMTIQQGFQAIAACCWEQVLANKAGVLSSDDGEFLHQMRIGIRRLRLALRLFAPALDIPQTLETELAWLGAMLGQARDAAVIADHTLPAIASAIAAQAAWTPLLQYARAQAQHHLAGARLSLASQRYARLEGDLGSWLQDLQEETGTADPARKGGRPLRPYARRRLRHLRAKLARTRGASDSEVAVHSVRIAAKKLRYASEFFASLCGAKRVARRLRRLGHLQQLLGELHDATVACSFLRGVEAGHPGFVASAALSRGYLLARSQQQMDRFREL